MIDQELIQQLVEKSYFHHVSSTFGDDGLAKLTHLLDSLRLVLKRCPPERLSGSFTFVVRVTHGPANIPFIGDSIKVQSDGHLEQLVFAATQELHSFIEFCADGSRHFISLSEDLNLSEMAKECILVRYENGTDTIYSGEFSDEVGKVSHMQVSAFATPTFSGLEEALRVYGELAKHCGCKLLARAWAGGQNGLRLIFSAKPESHMRDSLVANLSAVLQDATVSPEHNTDETKPVDIKVDWFGRRATALLEVKWLGKALTANSTQNDPKYTSYAKSRACSGANQLADYLEREKQTTLGEEAKGYLIVFDGRRKKVADAGTEIAADDAMAFEDSEITYSSKLNARDDFADPVRYFLRPRLQAAS